MFTLINQVLWDWPMFALFFACWLFYVRLFYYRGYSKVGSVLDITLFSGNINKHENQKALSFLMQNIVSFIGRGNFIFLISVILIGGPGSIFWFLVFGLISMLLRLAQTVILYYYAKDGDESYKNGIPYCIEVTLKRNMNFKYANVLGVLFSISLCLFGFLSVQNYYTTEIIFSVTNISKITISVVFSLIIAILILLKIDSSNSLLKKICGFVFLLYMAFNVIILIINIQYIIPACGMILTDAFQMKAFAGGIVAKGFVCCVRTGMQAAVYSNGLTSHYESLNNINMSDRSMHPIRVGMWSMVEVLIQTGLVTLTSFLLILTGYVSNINIGGTYILKNVIDRIYVNDAKILLVIFLLFFGIISCIVGLEHLLKELHYVFRKRPRLWRILNRVVKYGYPICGTLSVFLINYFSISSEELFIVIMGILIVPTVINIIVMIALSDIVKLLVKDYVLKYDAHMYAKEPLSYNYKEEERKP